MSYGHGTIELPRHRCTEKVHYVSHRQRGSPIVAGDHGGRMMPPM